MIGMKYVDIKCSGDILSMSLPLMTLTFDLYDDLDIGTLPDSIGCCSINPMGNMK